MSTTKNLDDKIKEFWPKNGPATQEIEKYVKKIFKRKNSYQVWRSNPCRSKSI